MYALTQMYEATRDFMELGGTVLAVIAWVTFVMWVLIPAPDDESDIASRLRARFRK